MKNELINQLSILLELPISELKKNSDKSLLLPPFSMNAEKLLYLYYYLKIEHNLEISNEELIKGGFTTIDKISLYL